MLKHGESSMIINVTSDEAYIAQEFEPMYSDCKRAMRNDTVILRLALKGTRIRVVEVVPPATSRNLPGQGATQAVSLEKFANRVFGDLIRGEAETIGIEMN